MGRFAREMCGARTCRFAVLQATQATGFLMVAALHTMLRVFIVSGLIAYLCAMRTDGMILRS